LLFGWGDGWTENTAIHDVRNTGMTNAHFMLTYVIAKGQPGESTNRHQRARRRWGLSKQAKSRNFQRGEP
jgi:hypothetical protein